MKQFLSGLLAASIMTSIVATGVYAASTNATFQISLNALTVEDSTEEPTLPVMAKGTANMNVSVNGYGMITFQNQKAINTSDNASTITAAFSGATSTFSYSGTTYTVTLKQSSTGSSGLVGTVYPAGLVNFTVDTVNDISFSPAVASSGTAETDTVLQFKDYAGITASNFSNGSGGSNDLGNQTLDIAQVVYCDSSNTAIPLVESKSDLNGQGDGVKSGTTVYFLINEPFDNDSYFKVKASKGQNSKNISSIEVVSKYFTSELYSVYGGNQLTGGITTGRHSYVKVKLNELYTDDEYKITFDLKVSLTSSGEERYPNFVETSIDEDDITAIWLKNKVDEGDGDYSVGTSGSMINPLINDWNEILWYDEDGDLAHLRFFADSDVAAFYSKLSTKWSHDDYAAYFNDQDAYMFEFTGSPSLSSTSRADLSIYNPFVDVDGNETIDPTTATIYQIIDGDLYDVTDSFTYDEGDNGEMAYITRTRFLGTYIICEKPVEEAMSSDETLDEEEDLLPDEEITVTPEEILPDEASKQPANTGKYRSI